MAGRDPPVIIDPVSTLEVDAPAGATRTAPGRWWRILSPIGATFAGLAMVVAAYGLLESLTPLGETETAALATLAGSLTLLALGLALWRALPAHERRIAVETKGSRGKGILIGLATGIGCIVVLAPIFVLGELVDPSVGRRLEDSADDIALDGALWANVIIVASLVVLAPLSEELLDRALLLRGLARVMRFLPAAIVSSIVFSLSHLDAWVLFLWPRGIWLAATGLALAWVYRRRGYLPAVATHATVNSIAAISLVATS